MDDAYVVEIASTGGRGCSQDAIVEMAICRVRSDGTSFETIYNDGIAVDPLDLGKDALDYMEVNYGIMPEELYSGSPQGRVVSDFQRMVFGNECTSFDVSQTFGKFLSFEPWDATGNLTILPSISARLPLGTYDRTLPPSTVIPSVYRSLCPDDPASVGEGRRALHLAQMSASILSVLRRNGLA